MTSFAGSQVSIDEGGEAVIFGDPAFMLGPSVDRMFGSSFPSPPAGYGYVYVQQGGDNHLLTIVLDDGKTYSILGRLS